MRSRILVLVSVVLVGTQLAGCGDAGPASGGSQAPPSTSGTASTAPPGAPAPIPDAAPAILASAVEHLVAENHTFGDGPPPFTEYLVQERLDSFAGNPTGGAAGEQRLLGADERVAIEAALRGFGPVRWISDPDEWRTDDLIPTIDGSVIIGVGEPELSGDVALVPMSLWCGGLCGTWLTYRVELIDGSWQVTGTEGPIAIS